jgi:hypothetical protein
VLHNVGAMGCQPGVDNFVKRKLEDLRSWGQAICSWKLQGSAWDSKGHRRHTKCKYIKRSVNFVSSIPIHPSLTVLRLSAVTVNETSTEEATTANTFEMQIYQCPKKVK